MRGVKLRIIGFYRTEAFAKLHAFLSKLRFLLTFGDESNEKEHGKKVERKLL